jgi:general secretion pathway protein D
VGFRLENADLLQFINLVASELKMNYIVDAAVKGAVTISTSGDLKPEDLLPILESVLKMNGATAIKTGNFYRIVPLSSAPKNPLGLSTSSNAAELPSDDRMLMQIIPLKFVFAADIAKMLSPFLSEGGTVAVLDAGNTLILVDDSMNVKRLMEIIQQFDNTSFAAQRIRLLPVRNNMASALVPELEAIFSTYALSDKQSPLRFLPLDRINGILVAAADPVAFAEVEQWIGKLDMPATPNGIQTFVYKVQYSDAGRLVRLLKALRGSGGETSEETGTGISGPGRGGGRGGAGGSSLQEASLQQGSSGTAAGMGLLSQEGGKGSGAAAEQTLRIITDPISNSVIVQGTAQEYADIAKTLDKLDMVPRQVQIEARVYEVDLTGALSFGLEYTLQQRSSSSPSNGLVGPSAPSTALTFSAGMYIGHTLQLMGFLNASENRTRVRTLSAPTLLTMDSTEARIQVGASVPMLTSQALVAGAQGGGSSLFTNTINNQDTGIMLSVTPRITSTGLVSLRINQEVSVAIPPVAGAGIQSPSISKRSVTTQAVAQDGQTIALGGMISYSNTKTINRIPLLGDIPWLGVLFGSTSYTTSETELIVLLTPHIISTLPAATAATRELEDKLKDLRREFKKDALLKP